MKRLFEVVKRHKNGHRESIRIEDMAPVYTKNKKDAKAYRDACNIAHNVYDDDGNQLTNYCFIVTRGPDHWKNKSTLQYQAPTNRRIKVTP